MAKFGHLHVHAGVPDEHLEVFNEDCICLLEHLLVALLILRQLRVFLFLLLSGG